MKSLNRVKQRSMVLCRRQVCRLNLGGLPPRRPRFSRWRCWLAFSEMVWAMPRRREEVRKPQEL
ncbi:hypothetical protein [Streptomyces alkaliphilus]|uniref:hypothetical protein n=1 Tax=Streptomyces alkaliphilus TaxID=1472722 RepID=UPI0011813A5B|nr:hypothetical protein [Streptomyces alkaliphilus]MQS06626.1 hypothetical protein [Streptomyces alkaliphilus]